MCPGDLDTQYIGETERKIFLRINEHTTPTNSSVFSHIETCTWLPHCQESQENQEKKKDTSPEKSGENGGFQKKKS